MFDGISSTGNGLTVLISCEFKPSHDWMVFASWYSIYKNLPDAKVKIACLRTNCIKSLFSWPLKCKIPFSQYSEKTRNVQELFGDENALIITPDVMAVTEFLPKDIGPSSSKSDINTTFVSYLDGCGKFVVNEWIDTLKNPFHISAKLYSNNLSLNEYRILKIWEKCYTIYNALV